MRLVASLLATLALSTSIATPVADACGGGYEPRLPTMFLVAAHHGRVFVLLDKNVDPTATLDWKGDRMSYDRTQIAVAPAFTTARKLTLVGPTHARSLASKNHVFITPVFETRKAMNALEIYPRGEEPLRLAIDGEFKSVAWSELESVQPNLETIAWAQRAGFTPALDPSNLYLSKVTGTDLELITAYPNDGSGMLATYVRPRGGAPWGGYRGSPLGVVTLDGVRYLVLVNDGLVSPIAI